MKDLNDLMVYLAVVDHGSYTLAGQALGLPKSNISRKVSRLEKSLGVQLLERTTRNVAMTELGEIYYQYCSRIKEELLGVDLINQSEAEQPIQPIGTLKIGCSVSIGQELLAFHLSQFRLKYPLFKLKLALTNRMIDIEEEDFDVVIRVAQPSSPQLKYKKLIDVEMRLFASEGYLQSAKLEGKPLNSAENLNSHDCLCINTNKSATTWNLLENGTSIDVSIDSAVSSNDYFVLKTMAEQGLGIALLPDYFVEPECSDLVSVLPDVIGERTTIYAVYKPRAHYSEKITALLDYLSENIA